MKRTGLLGWAALLAVALTCAVEVGAASKPATVRGPERAFIRRGPGTEFQAFATVENGEQVTVEEVTGTWALVRTTAGESGYVHANFLVYVGTTGPISTSLAPTSAPTAGSAPTPAAPAAAAVRVDTPPASAALDPRLSELATENEALRREVETLRRSPAAVASPGEDLVSLRAEVRRLADTTDALRNRLDAPSSGGFPGAAPPEGQWSTATVVVLAGCALVLGWVLGGVISRREERGRRNRIRF